jgi:large subunit ribosomal protein L32
MAVPKKRMSNSKTAMRRAHHDILTPPTLGKCPDCGAAVRPHHVCGTCGKYKGRVVIAGLAEQTETPAE